MVIRGRIHRIFIQQRVFSDMTLYSKMMHMKFPVIQEHRGTAIVKYRFIEAEERKTIDRKLPFYRSKYLTVAYLACKAVGA